MVKYEKLVDLNKEDPEKKLILVQILLNANYALLEYLLTNFPEFNCDLSILTYDYNPLLHLALSLASIEKYRERCE